MIFFKIPNSVASEQEVANASKTLISPNKTYVFVNKDEISLSSSQKEIYVSPVVTIQPNKDVHINLDIPLSKTTTSWGGSYINISVKVNDTSWYNLGNPGYCSAVMNEGSASTGVFTHSKLLDFIPNGGVSADTSYTLQFKITGRSYNYTTWINKDCDINAANKGAKGDKIKSVSDQNYMRLIIREVG